MSTLTDHPEDIRAALKGAALLTTAQIANLTTQAVTALTSANYAALSTAQLAGLNAAMLSLNTLVQVVLGTET